MPEEIWTMLSMPFMILWMWVRGVVAVALLGGGMYLLYHWYDTLPRPVLSEQEIADAARAPVPQRPALDRVAHWHPGLDWDTAALGGGLFLVCVAAGGGAWLIPLWWRAGTPQPGARPAGTVQTLTRPDGTTLHIECYG